jgi:hypothetical protein
VGLAAAQPSVARQKQRTARTDAQLLIALDNSRSMLAASTADGAPRYRRAVAFAHRLHDALPNLAVGVGSLNNRLLPYLFPTLDGRAFDSVLDQAFGIGRPPPEFDLDHWVTNFAELRQATAREFFPPTARKRIIVVLSDAETRPFGARSVFRDLRRHGATPVVVRFWRADERIFHPDGTSERYGATQAQELPRLRAAGWQAYPETEFDVVVGSIRRTLGPGPVANIGYLRRETSIAPALALAALGPLLLVLAPAGLLLPLRRQRRSAEARPALGER